MSVEAIGRLREIIRILRSPEGCPWDREQTASSLRPLLLEECHEVIQAVNNGDAENLQEELGDLLLLLLFFIQLNEESSSFTLEDVVHTVCEKLVRRHPHVFGDARAENSGEVLKQWEQIKRKEKGDGKRSIFEGISFALPALLFAQNAQKKAARVGFDWSSASEVPVKIREELVELETAVREGQTEAMEEELGDLLFSVVNFSRKLELDAETSLSSATSKFIRRFQAMESLCEEKGVSIESLSFSEMDALWDRIKASA